jgi:DNA-binding transcriptional LysR family regulator
MSRATFAMETRIGRLVQVPLSPPLYRHFSVVYPKERIHSRLVNAFVAFAKERMTAMQRGGETLLVLTERVRAARGA